MYNEEAGADAALRGVRGAGRVTAVHADRRRRRSRDGTAAVLGEWRRHCEPARRREPRCESGVRRGAGTGAREARAGFDYVLFMDSDLTNDPGDIPRFLDAMDEGAT